VRLRLGFLPDDLEISAALCRLALAEHDC